MSFHGHRGRLARRAARSACTVLLLAGCTSAEPAPDVRVVVDSIAQRYVDETPIVGLTVAVAQGGRIVYEHAYGLAGRAPDVAAEANTPFEIFSVGKMFTAVLALRLAERGVLDLDTDIATYVRDVPPPYNGTTLRQLLHHGSGTSGSLIDEIDPPPRVRRPIRREQVIEYLGEGRRVDAPDRMWRYNNQGFWLPGFAAAEATGSSYSDLVRTELADPLVLDLLRYCPEVDAIRSEGYMVRDGAIGPIVPVDFSWFGGAGSLCAPAGTVARWWNGVRGGRILDSASVHAMMTPATLVDDDGRASFGYGLGLRIGEYGGHRLLGHTGNGAGGTAVLAEYPDDSLVIVVATNTAGDEVPHAAEIGAAIARRLLQIEISNPALEAVPASALDGAPGLYRSPEGAFCITASDSALFVSSGEGEPEVLLHMGDGRFRRPATDASDEFFPGWPNDFAWFAYRFHGFPMDLAIRVANRCTTDAGAPGPGT
jgi:CubicO group peptidase (beta-lactamase class C family)